MRKGAYFYDQKDHVKQMTEVLTEGQWKFSYRVTAISPRGFEYVGDGENIEEAFLCAFGLWKRDLLARAKRN
jgi:hypothetical protein